MLKNTIINIGVIKKVAAALGNLNEQVVYVGGAVVSLYADDEAADDVRPTKDIDISLSIATLHELEILRQELVQKGFIQSAEDDVVCRFRFEDIKVDVMSTIAVGWAPANPWFAPGFNLKQQVEMDGQFIRILPLSYFLASKFTAYNDRGNKEPRTSHDFEDITYLLDNRIHLAEEINNSPEDVRTFLKIEFTKIVQDSVKQEAIMANLYYETQTIRFNNILSKLNAIVNTD